MKQEKRNAFRKAAKVLKILWTVTGILASIAVLGIMIYLGATIWKGIFPYWGK